MCEEKKTSVSEEDAVTPLKRVQTPEEKRKSLIHAAGELKVGRREAPEPVSFKDSNKASIRGLLLGLVVVVVAVAILMIVASITRA